MAAYNKFNSWVEYLVNGTMDLLGSGGTTANMLIAYLTNATPDAALDLVKADLAEIGAGGGYTGPVNLNNEGTRTTGTITVTGESFTITASGAIAEFRYVVAANDTVVADPLMSWWDYGAAVNMTSGETFQVLFNGAASGADGTLFTLT